MPNLDYFLRTFSDSSVTSLQKNALIPEFSNALYKHAVTAMQKRASTHGVTENYSIRSKTGAIINGLMQECAEQEQSDTKIFYANLNVNAFFTGANAKEDRKLNVGSCKDLVESKTLYSEDQYQGFMLIGLPNCEAIDIINPYSNPFFYGNDLFNNLWVTTITSIPFIFAPVINNTVYTELVKKYYQAEIFRVASNSAFGFADEFTPQYFKPARRTLLSFEMLKMYDNLSEEVSQLFVPEVRESIKNRVFYATTARHIKVVLTNLEQCMQQLANNPTSDPEAAMPFQALTYRAIISVNDCVAKIQEYINNLNKNLGWRFEQAIELNLTTQSSINLALEKTDIQLVIDNAYSIIKLISQKLWRSQELLSSYTGETAVVASAKTIVLPSLANRNNTGILLLITQRLDEFKESLTEAINNKLVRDGVLNKVNEAFTSCIDGKNPINVKVLTDEQLVNIYQYVLKILNDKTIKHELLRLRWQDLSGLPTNSYFIPRKIEINKFRDPQLIRSITLSLSKHAFKLGLNGNRKSATGSKILPKFKGHIATVTPQFDISPYPVDKLDAPQASKSIDLSAINNEYDLDVNIKILQKNIDIAHKMGHVVIGNSLTYSHYKKSSLGYRVAARLTEQWATTNLLKFMEHDRMNNNLYLMQDSGYQQAKDSGDFKEISKLRAMIIARIIGDVLADLVKLHNVLKVVHNDVKPENILLIVDEKGNLRARLADFDMSQYISVIQTTDCQPVASCGFASPQVVGFTVSTTKKLTYDSLLKDFKCKDASKRYIYVDFGRELLYSQWQSLTKVQQDEYANMQADPKDDCFSLGVTLFILLTGRYPTINNSNKNAAYGAFNCMHVQQAYKQLPQYKELLEGLLLLDRDKRFSAADAVAAYKQIDISTQQFMSAPRLLAQ